MKKLLLLAVFAVMTTALFSQKITPDTVFFKTGRVLACKIVEVTTTKIKVRPFMEYESIVDSYNLSLVDYYSINGKVDSTKSTHYFSSVGGVSDSLNQSFDYYLLQSGQATRTGGNLMLSGFLLTLSGAAMIIKSPHDSDVLFDFSEPLVKVGTVFGIAGLICTISGQGYLVKGGNLMIKASKRYSIQTNGNGISVKF